MDEKELKEMLDKINNSKKKKKFSKMIVSLVITLNIIFTIAILFVFLRTGNEPMTLVGAWFTFTTVELWSLSKIKRSEVESDE